MFAWSDAGVTAAQRVAALGCWSGPVAPEAIPGGLSNANFLVEDGGRRYVVRVADDIPEQQILRFNEVACHRAAHAAGLAPPLVHTEPGILVSAHVPSRTLTPEDMRDPAMLARIVPLLRRTHDQVKRHLRGPVLGFSCFHAIRDYLHRLAEDPASRDLDLGAFAAMADRCEAVLGPQPVVVAHNDMMAGNFLDDGARLWLIDWEYAGLSTPLFDLANISSNNDLDEAGERYSLELYFGAPADAARWRQYRAMHTACCLREALWSRVSERLARVAFDFAGYTALNLERYERAKARLAATG